MSRSVFLGVLFFGTMALASAGTSAGDGGMAALLRILQDAHAGERAAAIAYSGHGRSLRDPRTKAEVMRIRREELEHRAELGLFLRSLGSRPRRGREVVMPVIGSLVAASCFVGGRTIPMFGAGRIESANVIQYEKAAALASRAGHGSMAERLRLMADVERAHEEFFFAEAARSRLGRVLLEVGGPSARWRVLLRRGRRFTPPTNPCT